VEPDAVALAAPEADAFTISIAGSGSPFPSASAADGEADPAADRRVVTWPTLANLAPPAGAPEFIAPSVRDIGVAIQSWRDGVGRLGLRRSVELRLHAHHHARALKRDKGHDRADLVGGLLASLSPSRHAAAATSDTARF
jgi:hypothetical protein